MKEGIARGIGKGVQLRGVYLSLPPPPPTLPHVPLSPVNHIAYPLLLRGSTLQYSTVGRGGGGVGLTGKKDSQPRDLHDLLISLAD